MASSEKRCLYEILGLNRDCTADEIRTAYKKLALQRHPDKLIQSGVSEAEATASFQELVNAYEVLSDPRERSWYDSHRSQILFSSSTPSNSSNSSVIPNLFSFFFNSVFSGYSDSGKGFYKVYSDVFDNIYQTELNFAKKLGVGLPKEAPLMGNLQSPYAQVTAFYNYWLGFITVMDFCWADQYDVMAGPNRKSRRVMEDENKKLRKKARREYNETVRGLAEFVKKRDKRVIDMQVKRNEEMEKKREEERERKKELERARAERARAYEEQEWTKVDEEEELENGVEEGQEDGRKKGDEELYCVICGKKFKSEKQWNNHEQSKKHKEKVAELRKTFRKEQRKNEEEEEEEVLGGHKNENGEHGSDFLAVDEELDELRERFQGSVGVREKESDDEDAQLSKEEGFADVDNGAGLRGDGVELGSDDDDETSFLDAMVSGHKVRRNTFRENVGSRTQASGSSMKEHVAVDADEIDFMEYDSRKSSRRNRRGRRESGTRAEEVVRDDLVEMNSQPEENNVYNDGSHTESLSSHSVVENETNGNVDDRPKMRPKSPKQAVDKKASTKKDAQTKSKNSAKERKKKGTPKSSGNTCEACGEEFESRNKLHKHLGDTGHAVLKFH